LQDDYKEISCIIHAGRKHTYPQSTMAMLASSSWQTTHNPERSIGGGGGDGPEAVGLVVGPEASPAPDPLASPPPSAAGELCEDSSSAAFFARSASSFFLASSAINLFCISILSCSSLSCANLCLSLSRRSSWTKSTTFFTRSDFSKIVVLLAVTWLLNKIAFSTPIEREDIASCVMGRRSSSVGVGTGGGVRVADGPEEADLGRGAGGEREPSGWRLLEDREFACLWYGVSA
jgi:hypothetical protein